MPAPIFIAVAGPSGSGKTALAYTISEELKSEVNDKHVLLLSEDAYYKDQSHLAASEREKTNYDHPSAFDYPLLLAHIKRLRSNEAIHSPIYDYVSHTRSAKTNTLHACPIIIIEGILLLSNSDLLSEFDLKLFVDTPLDICLTRRIKRDIQDRGRSLDSVLEQYEQSVRPMCERFVMPSRLNADLIVPHGGKNRAAIDMIKAHITTSI